MKTSSAIKRTYFCFVFCLLFGCKVVAQQRAVTYRQTQYAIDKAIAKSYQACVLMWEIDADRYTRLSAQFSGVVVSADGTILSAAHVVTPGKTYQVMFPDGRECQAKGLGRIRIAPDLMQPDAAMLKITRKGSWPFAEMGWSSSLSINQPCLSIAYPESITQRKPTIRFGHISALKNQYGFLQSTCIMEPGDSGGPLFDLYGRVIGIHSGIQIPEDINYEIPVDTYRRYHTALLLGKDYQALPADTDAFTPDTLNKRKAVSQIKFSPDAFKTTQSRLKQASVRIRSTVNGTVQEISGTVVAVKGTSPNAATSLRSLVVSKSTMIGDNPVVLLGNKRVVALKVLLRSRIHDLVLLSPSKKLKTPLIIPDLKPNNDTGNKPGKLLLTITGEGACKPGILESEQVDLPKVSSYGYIGAYIDMEEGQLRVKSVQPGGAADMGGLKKGDRVKAFGDQIVRNNTDYVKVFQQTMAGDTILIEIERAGETLFKKIILSYAATKASDHPVDKFTGGKSQRRDGFNGIYTQDAVIKTDECGSPVFDLYGSFVGINIARYSRAITVIISAGTLISWINTNY